jgi:CRISPR-associated protein Cas5/DevS
MANPHSELVELFLHLKAPFAAFRPFQSGSYRSTTAVPSPSTVYGLILNLAGIEQRKELAAPVTLIKEDLPEIEIAIGQVSQPEIAFLSQQLHQYPVGASGAELAQKTYGAKYWIAPVRRAVLVNLDLIVGVRAEKWLCDRLDWVRVPDLTYVSYNRLAVDWFADEACPVIPELAIEIISPGQTFGEMTEKATNYLKAGVSRVWVVDTKAKTITIFYPDAPPQTKRGEDSLEDSLFEKLQITPQAIFQQAGIP